MQGVVYSRNIVVQLHGLHVGLDLFHRRGVLADAAYAAAARNGCRRRRKGGLRRKHRCNRLHSFGFTEVSVVSAGGTGSSGAFASFYQEKKHCNARHERGNPSTLLLITSSHDSKSRDSI